MNAPAEPGPTESYGRPLRFGARRQLVFAVVGCAVAASAALFAASRTWLVQTTPRPQPQPDLVENVSGGALVPLTPALALVALAGAGALVATRGLARLAVGVLLAVCGLGLVIIQRDALHTPGVAIGWVAVVAVAGIVVGVVGAFTLRNGQRWPVMGSRYERAGATPAGGSAPVPVGDPVESERTAEESRVADGARGTAHTGDTAWWDAIDRGEDPTKD